MYQYQCLARTTIQFVTSIKNEDCALSRIPRCWKTVKNLVEGVLNSLPQRVSVITITSKKQKVSININWVNPFCLEYYGCKWKPQERPRNNHPRVHSFRLHHRKQCSGIRLKLKNPLSKSVWNWLKQLLEELPHRFLYFLGYRNLQHFSCCCCCSGENLRSSFGSSKTYSISPIVTCHRNLRNACKGHESHHCFWINFSSFLRF